MKKIICNLFGHKWLYNFSTMPHKSICIRCKEKSELNLTELMWYDVGWFRDEKRTDEELIKEWVNIKN